MIFLLNKSQFSVNSVVVVKVKIPFSDLLKVVEHSFVGGQR